MRLLIATVCAIASTIIAAAPVTDLEQVAPVTHLEQVAPVTNLEQVAPVTNLEQVAPVTNLEQVAPVTNLEQAALSLRHADPRTSRVIVCPPGANGHCDQQVHVIPQANTTAAKKAFAMHNAFEQNQNSDDGPPHAASAGFDPKTATIMVCSGAYYTGPCDHPSITDAVCKQMTVGNLVNGPPLAGPPLGMSSMWVGDKIDHCILSCGLNCEDINDVGGFENWGNIEDMTIGLLKPLDNMILSYKCFMA